jgi:hypothetical protein
MNYKPFVSWGVYGASAAQRPHFFVSWGLMALLPAKSIIKGIYQGVMSGIFGSGVIQS